MNNCNHNHLDRLEGPLHPSGKDYVCKDCGQQFKAEPIVIGVSFGRPKSTTASKEPSDGDKSTV